MTSLSDYQLQIVMDAARPLVVEKRDIFLQRIAAELGRIRRPGDQDVDHAVRVALRGLLHESAA